MLASFKLKTKELNTALKLLKVALKMKAANKLNLMCEVTIKDGQIDLCLKGVYGLQRAFKMASTENIIMSLWQVPVKETTEFMQTFYDLLFVKQNITKHLPKHKT
jgi:CHAT domain-containing protein